MVKFDTLAVPTSVAVGAAKEVSNLVNVALNIGGVFTATYQLEVSFDGVTFTQHGANATAPVTITALGYTPKQIRWRCTAYTSGTPTSGYSGLKSGEVS